ncbi:MAG: molybdopterin-dependent oxidoreductase [bacterium]
MSTIDKAGRSEHVTFCRICEAMCGAIAIVEDGRIVDVRADNDNPHSKGFMCTKGKAMVDVVYDSDRVLAPLKRVGGPGEFEPCSWDEALDDIARRLKAIVNEHGGNSFAAYVGNPTGFSTAGPAALIGLCRAIGGAISYGVNGEDHGADVAALALQYGSSGLLARPDVWRTDFLLMSGANPWVSKGSTISEPQIRKAMRGIVERGGRVVVVDPRRTETARHFEHVAIRPGTDAWLLLGMLRVMVNEGRVDSSFVRAHVSGYDRFVAVVRRVELAACASRCGVPAESIADIARGFAGTRSAAAYCRIGASTQRFGTLNNMLINALNIVTGNVNKPGGSMFGWGAIDFPKLAKAGGVDAYAPARNRSGLPQTLGTYPTQSLWRDITEPGPDRIRAMCTYSGNPVLCSGAGGARLQSALEQLDLHFSLDFYVNETNKHAHYILPSPTFYERQDIAVLGMALAVRPTIYATDKVIEPRGESRDEWRVFNEIGKRMGLGGAYSIPLLRWLARRGFNLNPIKLYDAAIRTSPVGDLFGLRRRGWSLKKLRHHPHGVALAEHLPAQKLEELLATPDKKIHLGTEEFVSEAFRLLAHTEDYEAYPLRAIGLRESRSQNSWMHNSPRLMPDSRRPTVRVHPEDARAAGVSGDGDLIEIESASGRITMGVTLTEDMSRGTVAVPHGWGHHGGWRRANAAGGANFNDLVSVEEGDIERLAGMSILSGIPVRIRPAGCTQAPADRVPVAGS